jgi:hypothetical protein
MRRLIALTVLAVAAALALSVQSASAAPTWHFGPLEQTWINDCYDSFPVNGVQEYAGALYDDAAPPKPGDVFYVNVVVQGVDSSCPEITLPDISLPSDMSPAISAGNPILCYTVDTSANTETPDTADCPSALGAPLNGGTGSIRDNNGPAPGSWDVRAPAAYEFRIPVTAGTPGVKTIDFPNSVASENTWPIDPEVVVGVDPAGNSGPTPPAPGPNTPLTLGAGAKSAKLSSRGVVSFAISSSQNATGTAGGTISLPKGATVLRLGTRKIKLTAGKATKVALKLSKKNAAAVRKALKRGKKLSAHIVINAKTPSGISATKKLSLKLAR